MPKFDFKSLKELVAKLEREHAKQEAHLEHEMHQLKDQFNVDSLDEAQTLLTSLIEKLAKLEKRLEKETAAFESKWLHVLDQ